MAATMNAVSLPRMNPARCWGADASAEVVLAAKLAWLLLVCGGVLARVGQTDLATADQLGVVPGGLTWMFRLVFVATGVLLLVNQFVRPAATIAGACVVLAPLLSVANWRSHEWVCGMVLLLAGLETPGARPWLLRAQATLCLAAVACDQMGAIDWTTRATLEGWQVDRDAHALLGVLRSTLPAALLRLFAGWIVPASALAIGAALWVPVARQRAVWFACAWLIAGYVVVGTDEAAFFTLAVLVALLSFLEWPRESLAAHWPRACGWPMWLRIALDHYDFDRKTEWPFPANPDADLDVWTDGKHRIGRNAICALLLYFPLFHFAVFAAAVLLLLLLPQPWATLAHACLGGWLLAFFAFPVFRSLNERWTH